MAALNVTLDGAACTDVAAREMAALNVTFDGSAFKAVAARETAAQIAELEARLATVERLLAQQGRSN
jgi:hypothetical protein